MSNVQTRRRKSSTLESTSQTIKKYRERSHSSRRRKPVKTVYRPFVLFTGYFPITFYGHDKRLYYNPYPNLDFSRYKNHKIPPTRNGTSKTRGQIVNSARFFIAVSVKFSTDMVCANTHDDYESAKNETMLGDFDLSFFVASDEDEYIVLYQHYPTIIHMASPIRDYVEAIFQDGISDMIDHIMEMVGVLTTEEDIAMSHSNSIL